MKINPTANRLDPIDRVLRDDVSRYIDDNGFSARVIAALPARAVPRHAMARILWPLALTFLACVVVFILTPGGAFIAETLAGFAYSGVITPATFAVGATLVVFYWFGIAGAMEES